MDLKQTTLIVQKNHLNDEKVDTRVVDVKVIAKINEERVVNFWVVRKEKAVKIKEDFKLDTKRNITVNYGLKRIEEVKLNGVKLNRANSEVIGNHLDIKNEHSIHFFMINSRF